MRGLGEISNLAFSVLSCLQLTSHPILPPLPPYILSRGSSLAGCGWPVLIIWEIITGKFLSVAPIVCTLEPGQIEWIGGGEVGWLCPLQVSDSKLPLWEVLIALLRPLRARWKHKVQRTMTPSLRQLSAPHHRSVTSSRGESLGSNRLLQRKYTADSSPSPAVKILHLISRQTILKCRIQLLIR